MIVMRSVLLSVVLYGAFIALSRWMGFIQPLADWVVLGLCAAVPLLDPQVRVLASARSPVTIAVLLVANAAILFGTAFWLISILFGEGL